MPSVLETELNQLRERVLLMGQQTEAALERAARALAEHDTELAAQVIAGDDDIDRLELEIEWECMRVLARWSPEARDLRFVMAVNRTIPILERIADHACNLAHAALAIGQQIQAQSMLELAQMSNIVREMLHATLDAFGTSDAAAARVVIERDEEVNQLYDKIFSDLLEWMASDPTAVKQAGRLLLVAKHLERIGDYVTDICEQVVYLKEALVIKHQRLST